MIGRLVGDLSDRSEDQDCWLNKWWVVEASIGRGESREIRRGPDGLGREFGEFMRLGLLKGITGPKWLLGIDLAGVARRGGPKDPGGWHEDAFFRSVAATLAFRPWGLNRGLMVRAGTGLGLSDVQRLRVADWKEETESVRSEKGWSWILGASYTHPVSARASLGFDVVWNRLGFDSKPRHVRVLAWGFGVKWHP